MNRQQEHINTFLVEVFNDILRLEEQQLQSVCKNVSVSEMHVIDAVHSLGGYAYMADVASKLHVTAGTLTASVKTLEQKGYLVRRRSEDDKRRVMAVLTEKCAPILAAHSAFHEKLCGDTTKNLTEFQVDALGVALANLHKYFETL